MRNRHGGNSPPNLAVVIPVFNEEKFITEAIHQLYEKLRQASIDYQSPNRFELIHKP